MLLTWQIRFFFCYLNVVVVVLHASYRSLIHTFFKCKRHETYHIHFEIPYKYSNSCSFVCSFFRSCSSIYILFIYMIFFFMLLHIDLMYVCRVLSINYLLMIDVYVKLCNDDRYYIFAIYIQQDVADAF